MHATDSNQTPWLLLRRDAEASDFIWSSDEAFVEVLVGHGLAGFVRCRLRGKEQHVPVKQLESLVYWHKVQKQRNLVYQIELEQIAAMCTHHGIGAVLLKGMAFLGWLYKDLGARHIADIDLLVDPNDAPKLIEILKRSGYSSVAEVHWRANAHKHNLTRTWEGIELAVEVHSGLFASHVGEPLRSQPSGSGPFSRLALEETLFYMLAHLGHQHTFLQLSWLVDIDLLISQFGEALDWDRLASLTGKFAKTRSAAVVAWAAHRYLGTPMNPAIYGALDLESSLVWKNLLTSDFLWAPTAHPIRYPMVKHLLKETPLEALRYDWDWLVNRLKSTE